MRAEARNSKPEPSEADRIRLLAERLIETTVMMNPALTGKVPLPSEQGTDRYLLFRCLLQDISGHWIDPSVFARMVAMFHGREGNVIDFRKARLALQLREVS